MPSNPVIRYLQDELLNGMPLLVSSLGGDDEDAAKDGKKGPQLVHCMVDEGATWCDEVDFIVDAGGLPQAAPTVYDLTRRGDPLLIREGLGELELAL